jgi:glutaminyl-peptide cyclotransferase
LTHDREHLILSDGSSSLRFLSGFLQETKKRRARPWRAGEQPQRVGFVAVDLPHVSTDRIARISRASGDVISWIDLTGLLTPGAVTDPEAVLNGIAYDAVRDRLFVTGKLWPKIFEIQLERRR